MLRGNSPAVIDGKGRLKVPTRFRAIIEREHGRNLFITSVDGVGVRLYPFPIWEKVEARLSALPSFDPAVEKLVDLLNYFGGEAAMDSQGRVVIQPHLRQAAQMAGEVAVLGKYNHLEVWNNDRFQERLRLSPLTQEDRKILAGLGL
jgi:MraZ protein